MPPPQKNRGGGFQLRRLGRAVGGSWRLEGAAKVPIKRWHTYQTGKVLRRAKLTVSYPLSDSYVQGGRAVSRRLALPARTTPMPAPEGDKATPAEQDCKWRMRKVRVYLGGWCRRWGHTRRHGRCGGGRRLLARRRAPAAWSHLARVATNLSQLNFRKQIKWRRLGSIHILY